MFFTMLFPAKKYYSLIFFMGAALTFIVSLRLQHQKKQLVKLQVKKVLSDKITLAENFFTLYKSDLHKLTGKKETIDVLSLFRSLETEKQLTQQSVEQQSLINSYEKLLKDFFAHQAYSDIFLLSHNRTLVFAMQEKNLIGQDLSKDPYKGSALAEVANLSLVSLSSQLSSFIVDEQSKKVSIYLAQAVFDTKRFMGTVIIKINPEDLLTKMTEPVALGKTGEILLGQIFEKQKKYLVPPRNILLKDFEQRTPHDKQLFDATSGGMGTGEVKDYRQCDVIAAWDYLPETNVGIVVKQDLGEILLQVYWLRTCALILFACGLFIALLLLMFQEGRAGYYDLFNTLRMGTMNHYNFIVRFLCYGLFGLSLFLFFFALYAYHKKKHAAQEIAQTGQIINLRSITQQINSTLYQMEKFSNEFIQTYAKAPQDFKSDIKKTLLANKVISGLCVAFAPKGYREDIELYAPYVLCIGDKCETYQLETLYNYTYPQTNQKFDNEWYTLTMTTNAPSWNLAYLSGISAHDSIVYCQPLYALGDQEKTKPIGVVAVTYLLSTLYKKLAAFELSTANKCMLISSDGAFIYHPERKYMIQHQSITDIVKAEDRAGADQSVYYEKLLKKHLEQEAKEPLWTFIETIPLTGWIIATSFNQSEALRETDLLSPQIKSLVALMMVLALFSCILIILWLRRSWLVMVIIYSVMFLMGNLYLWRIIDKRPFIYPVNEDIIDDELSLKNLIDEQQQKAELSNTSLYVPIKTGISLSNLTVSLNREAHFTGFIWQRYSNQQVKDKIVQTIGFGEMQKLTMQETVRQQKGDYLYIGWDITGVNQQAYDLVPYPFLKQHIKINLIQKEQFQNVMPVPDFAGFNVTKENKMPWLEKKFTGLETSYFSYKKLVSKKKIVNQLTLNVVLKADVLQAFMGFMLPLFVVLIAAFASFWRPSKDRSGIYSGLAFATVIVQQTFRSKVPSDSVVYLEWFVILSYLTLFILTIIAIISTMQDKKLKDLTEQQGPIVAIETFDSWYLKLFYWPVQFTVWFLVTAVFFM